MEIITIVLLVLIIVAVATNIIMLIMLLRHNQSKQGGITAKELTSELGAQTDTVSERIRATTDTLTTALNVGNAALINSQSESQKTLNASVTTLISDQKSGFNQLESKLTAQFNTLSLGVNTALYNLRLESESKSDALRNNLDVKIKELTTEVAANLTKLREDNDKQLKEMNKTVDEKLQSTLTERIDLSFKQINEQLVSVQKGLGEMQNVTSSVTNLNRVLSGVKSRGTWGEVALEALLTQILAPAQFAKQVKIKKKNAVDFAVIMPGNNDGEILLPIDSKFPLADYETLVNASNVGDIAALNFAKAKLATAVKTQAKSISEKYIEAPFTTNFAIMYLPIEGLYAEVVRDVELMDTLQNVYHIVVTGPTTLSALLNALQIGFTTLTVQKESTKVWKILTEFKKNLGMLVSQLDKSKKNAESITDAMDKSIKRTEIISKKLANLDTAKLEAAETSVDNITSDILGIDCIEIIPEDNGDVDYEV